MMAVPSACRVLTAATTRVIGEDRFRRKGVEILPCQWTSGNEPRLRGTGRPARGQLARDGSTLYGVGWKRKQPAPLQSQPALCQPSSQSSGH